MSSSFFWLGVQKSSSIHTDFQRLKLSYEKFMPHYYKNGWSLICLFRVFRPTRTFFNHIERSSLRCWAANVDLYSAHMGIEKWGFFSVPYLLWHGTSVYNSDLRGPVTLTLIVELMVEMLSLLVLTTWVWSGSNPQCHRRDW